MKRRKDFLMNRGYSVRKFPVAYVALVFLMSVVMREIARSWGEDLFFKLIFGGILTFLVAMAGSVYLLHQNQQTRQVLALFWGSQLLSVILGACYGLVIRTEINYEGGLMQFGVLLLLVLVSLLLIAVLMRKNEKKIWFSWSILFGSVVFGVLVGLIVWGGLSAALGSIEALFELNLDSRWYAYFGAFSNILLGGGFALHYYLFTIQEARLTEDKELEIEDSRMRKILGVYIFLPLALLYLLIFLAYGAKILISGLWPKGIIVWLGAGFFVWGLLTMYATFPQKDPKFELLRKVLFGGFLFVAMMMAVAILKRIGQYGITINRYFICELILGIVIFSTLSLVFAKYRFSLFIAIFSGLSLVGLYGPFSAVNVSYLAQKTHLELTLMKNEIYLPLGSGELKHLTGDDAQTVGAILYHLIDEYEFTRLQNQIFSGCVLHSEDRRYVWSNVANCLGIDEDSSTVPVIEDFKIHELGEYSNKKGITVHNYQKIYNLNAIQDDDSSLPEHQYGFTLDDGKHVVFDFVPYFAILQELTKEEKKEGVVFEAELEGGKYKLVFDYLSFREEEGKVSAIFSFDGYLLEK